MGEYERKDQLVSYFTAKAAGKWDNVSWKDGDVGQFSKIITDRHGFESRYVRFKGQKTARLVPVAVFKKLFSETPVDKTDPKKWANREKGGTEVDYGKRKKRQFTRADLDKLMSKKTKLKEHTHMGTSQHDEENDEMINEAVSLRTPFFIMKIEKGGREVWALCKWNMSGRPTHATKQGKHRVIGTYTSQSEAAAARKEHNGGGPNSDSKKNAAGHGNSQDKESSSMSDTKKTVTESIATMVIAAADQDATTFMETLKDEMGLRLNTALDVRKFDIAQSIGKIADEPSVEGQE